ARVPGSFAQAACSADDRATGGRVAGCVCPPGRRGPAEGEGEDEHARRPRGYRGRVRWLLCDTEAARLRPRRWRRDTGAPRQRGGAGPLPPAPLPSCLASRRLSRTLARLVAGLGTTWVVSWTGRSWPPNHSAPRRRTP